MHWLRYLKGQLVWASKVCYNKYSGRVPSRSFEHRYSVQRNRNCNGEEVVLHPYRRLYDREGCHHLSKRRHCILWNGSGFPSTYRKGPQECTGILEDIWRISTNASVDAGDRYCDAAGNTIRVRRFTQGQLVSDQLVRLRRSHRGVRPFGVSLLVAGWDISSGPTLYQVDPSGSYWAWKASAIGKNMVNAKTFLEKRSVSCLALAATLSDCFKYPASTDTTMT